MTATGLVVSPRASDAAMAPGHVRRLQALRQFASRHWLWLVLSLSLAALLVALLLLVRSYMDTRSARLLEQDAMAIAADIRNGLVRNAQDLQAIGAQSYGPGKPADQAATMLAQHREMMRIEWRDIDLKLKSFQASRFSAPMSERLDRDLAMFEIQRACADARRSLAPSYSGSYFVPGPAGEGRELLDICVPYKVRGEVNGYLLATYSLNGLLTEFVGAGSRRRSALAITETDGTRLTSLGSVDWRERPIAVAHMLDLPGAVFMVRLERGQDYYGTLPKAVAAGTLLLGLVTMALLSLLAVDVRRRQRAEASLAEALAFRKAMEDSLITGLRARDMSGRITYVNPAFCRIVGMEPEALLGRSLPAPYWPPERVAEYWQQQGPPVGGAASYRQGMETEFMRPDGTRVPVLIVEAPLINADGTQTGWMSAVLDQSEKRRVEEITRATQERLQATARLAMVGEMASLISHELNQPLSAISSYANGSLNLLQQDGPLEPVRDDLLEATTRIADQSARAGRVIRSIADLVRRRERTRARTEVQSLFDGIDPLVSLQARKLGVVVETSVAPGCPDVLCDATMVEQVLLNLVRNGLQAMSPDAPDAQPGMRRLVLRAGLSCADADRPGRWVEFTVADQGQGLSDEAQRQLFTPLYTTKPEGMGLGLSLCRTVIEQHGGDLGHRPNSPRGTVFRFTLPTFEA